MAKRLAKSATSSAAAKRAFFVLTALDRTSLEHVEDVEDEGFDDGPLFTGKHFDGHFPPNFKIWLKRRKPTDLLGGPQDWLLVSNRFVTAIEPLTRGQVAVFPVPMFDLKTKSPVDDYKLLHVLGSLKAVAKIDGKLRIHFGTGIVYDAVKIPPTTNIFRMGEENARYIVVSGELRKALKAAGVVSLEYLETSTV